MLTNICKSKIIIKAENKSKQITGFVNKSIRSENIVGVILYFIQKSYAQCTLIEYISYIQSIGRNYLSSRYTTQDNEYD